MQKRETITALLRRQAPDLLFGLLFCVAALGCIILVIGLFFVKHLINSRFLSASQSLPFSDPSDGEMVAGLGLTAVGGVLAALCIYLLRRWHLPRRNTESPLYLRKRWHTSWQYQPTEVERRDFVYKFLERTMFALIALKFAVCTLHILLFG